MPWRTGAPRRARRHWLLQLGYHFSSELKPNDHRRGTLTLLSELTTSAFGLPTEELLADELAASRVDIDAVPLYVTIHFPGFDMALERQMWKPIKIGTS